MGTSVMADFIHDIRTDREREKAEYKKKGYSVSSNYLCLSKVDVVCDEIRYNYNVQVDKNEIKFYLSDKKANLYLSIYEIYDVLRSLPNKKRAMFKNAFAKHAIDDEVNKECYFLYKGIRYDMTPCVAFPKGKICLKSVGLELDCAQIYFLIHLIQNKSNSMFERSTVEKQAYINGIYRLFGALLRKRSRSQILEDKGWMWDTTFQKFSLDPDRKDRDIDKWKKKYYLTDEEYKTILGIKKS